MNSPRLLLAALLCALTTAAQTPLPFLSPVFGDNMVLQRAKPNPIWGWTQPGATVRAEIAGHSASATADPDGRWQLSLDPPPAGGPYTLQLSGPQTLRLSNVLVGDVWLCSGQSNMAFALPQARNGAEEVKNANYPQIRFFLAGQKVSYSRAEVPRGSWKVVSPENLRGPGGWLSAAAYFFARRVQASELVPIGLIQVAVGGVPGETLASPDSLRALPSFIAGLDEVERRAGKGPEYGNYITHWYDEFDIGTKNGSWADPALDEAAWKLVQVPGRFEELGVGGVPSLTWLRKEITLPDPLPAGRARLELGSVEKMDTAYINGRQVGASSWVENPRAYPATQALKPGRNVIAIRLFRIKAEGGGFLSGAASLRLVLGDGSAIPLAGEWKGRVAADARPPHPLPVASENLPSMPGILFRGMLEPFVPLALTGALWYQGESNTERSYEYRALLPALIRGWRQRFGQGDFPFYAVSLPRYTARKAEPGDDGWAELREAIDLTTRTVPNTCQAVMIDTGDANDIHPTDKLEVGDRLARCALAGHYHRDVAARGPEFASLEILPGALRVKFNFAEGLTARGPKPAEFAIAGEDRQWHWAEARLDGASVVLSSPDVPNPVAARYAWQANPEANLFNAAGLPAVPFRTDRWPGRTEPKSEKPQ